MYVFVIIPFLRLLQVNFKFHTSVARCLRTGIVKDSYVCLILETLDSQCKSATSVNGHLFNPQRPLDFGI